MESILVSVIIPVYNRSKLVARAIRSVAEQSYNSIELIVVDDGSTDDSVEIIKYELELNKDSFSQSKLLVQSNQGPSAARNYGIKESTGEFIFYLDSDDELSPDIISQVVEIGDPKETEAIHFGMELGKKEYLPSQGSDLMNELLMNRILGYGVAFARTRKLVLAMGGWNENLSYGEDKEYCLRSLFHAKDNIKVLKEVGYIVHRDAGANLSRHGVTQPLVLGVLSFGKTLKALITQDSERFSKDGVVHYGMSLYNIRLHALKLGMKSEANQIKETAQLLLSKHAVRSKSMVVRIGDLGETVARVYLFARNTYNRLFRNSK